MWTINQHFMNFKYLLLWGQCKSYPIEMYIHWLLDKLSAVYWKLYHSSSCSGQWAWLNAQYHVRSKSSGELSPGWSGSALWGSGRTISQIQQQGWFLEIKKKYVNMTDIHQPCNAFAQRNSIQNLDKASAIKHRRSTAENLKWTI